jgi:hypothetical protein
MNIKDCVDFLNFWIRKERGAFYTIEESVQLIDRAQLAYYNDIIPRYATSQIVKDTLEPFKTKLEFDEAASIDGKVYINDTSYLNLLSFAIKYTIPYTSKNIYYPVKMINEDELADKLNSQIDPPTITAPVGELLTDKDYNNITRYYIQLYPEESNTGFLYYMRRPITPVYSYTVNGRNIIYNAANSTQLEWRDVDIDAILLKALSSIGINLSDQEVSQFAELKSQQNYQGVNHL